MLCDYIPSLFDSYSNVFSCLKNRHTVHPEQPVAPKHSEFYYVNSQRRIRIIHIKPDITNVQLRDQHISHRQWNDKNQTNSGEYWFTCWNRPVPTDKCNCSFRKSISSNKNDKALISVQINQYNEKNSKIESYVENIITNALFVAYQEYMKKYRPVHFSTNVSNSEKLNGDMKLPCPKLNVSYTYKSSIL